MGASLLAMAVCQAAWIFEGAHIRFCGNGLWRFRSYSGLLGKAPSNQGLLPLTFGASPRLGMPSLRSCSVGPPPSAIHGPECVKTGSSSVGAQRRRCFGLLITAKAFHVAAAGSQGRYQHVTALQSGQNKGLFRPPALSPDFAHRGFSSLASSCRRVHSGSFRCSPRQAAGSKSVSHPSIA